MTQKEELFAPLLYLHRDSNANLGFRKPSFYPLNYGAIAHPRVGAVSKKLTTMR